MKRIEKELGITREKLILLGIILGGDYAIGIKGVGIVNAMEIVNAFDNIEALERFAKWAKAPDLWLNDLSAHYENITIKEKEYKLKHMNFKKWWEIQNSFPERDAIGFFFF